MNEEGFEVGVCRDCGNERVLLGGRCRGCLVDGLAEEVGQETLAAINRAFATASDRLLGALR